MFITPSDEPIPTLRSDASAKIALTLCTAGIVALGLTSCVFEGINALTSSLW